MQKRSEWYVSQEEMATTLLDLEHELEVLTARQNTLLDQALANMDGPNDNGAAQDPAGKKSSTCRRGSMQ